MTLLGVEGVFSPVRIQKNTLPDGFYRYELSGVKGMRFGSVQERRTLRYAGDFISHDPLPLDDGGKKALSSEDWVLDTGRKFDFESFWEHKLSINKQISNAEHKRDLAMGKTSNAREALKSELLEPNNYILE